MKLMRNNPQVRSGRNTRTSDRLFSATLTVIETLETRQMMTVAPDAASILGALDAGMDRLRAMSPAIEQSVDRKGGDTVVINTELGAWTGLGGDLRQVFASPKVGSSLSGGLATMKKAGWRVNRASTSPDANGNYLLVSFSQSWSHNGALSLGGASGFDYVDSFGGALRASASQKFRLVVGVDRDGFFVRDDSSVVMTLSGKGSVKSAFSRKALRQVAADTSHVLSLTEAVTFRQVAGDKIRAGSLGSADALLDVDKDGTITSTAKFHATLSQSIGFDYTGSAVTKYVNGKPTTTSKLTYDPLKVGIAISKGFFFSPVQLPWEAGMSSFLNRKVPIVGKTIGQVLNVGKYVSKYTAGLVSINVSSAKSIQDLNTRLAAGGAKGNWSARTVDQLIDGQDVDLVTWSTKGSIGLTPRDAGGSVLLADWEFFGGLANAELRAVWNVNMALKWQLGRGLSTQGVYVTPDTFVGLSGSLSGGIEGTLKVLHTFKVAKASGTLSLDGMVSLGLNDPNHDGKIYLAEIMPTGNYSEAARYIRADVQLDLNAHVEGKIRNPVGGLGIGSKWWTVYEKTFHIANLIDTRPGGNA